MSVGEGVSKRGRWQADPVLHIVRPLGSGWALWCSGGPAVRGVNTVRRRRCSACTALLRVAVEEEMASPVDLADWLRSTRRQNRPAAPPPAVQGAPGGWRIVDDEPLGRRAVFHHSAYGDVSFGQFSQRPGDVVAAANEGLIALIEALAGAPGGES